MFRAYYEAGMKPLDILQSATYLSAKALKKENEIGSIKSGAYADIIAVRGDLLENFLEVIENIDFVMKGGKVHKNSLD